MDVSSKQIEEDRRSMISQCSRAVAEMPKSDFTEMKSFNNPPVAVKDVLTATMILLGHSGAELDWRNIKKHMGKGGPDSLLKRIETFDFENVPQETREKAMNLLSKYTTDQIMSVSKAAKTLHEWAVAVADTGADTGTIVAQIPTVSNLIFFIHVHTIGNIINKAFIRLAVSFKRPFG